MGWGNSSKSIYRKMQVDPTSQVGLIAKADHVTRLRWLESFGFKWSVENEMLEQPAADARRYHYYDTPWCHARHLTGKECGFDHQVLFNGTGIIHPRCQNCWKTVLSPANFDELMTWKKVEENEIPFACKCGIELRDYTPKLYGAYHYAPSLDEGREQYEIVVELAKKYLSEETAKGVILKRACTEYEIEKGDSAYWTLTDEEEDILQLIEDRVSYLRVQKPQAAFVKPFVMMKWVQWAHYVGDMSYLPYNNGKAIYPGYRKYHEGNIQGLKHDIAILNAVSKNIPAEMAEEFITANDSFARTHGFTVDQLAPALGYNKRTPLGKLSLEELQVAEELIGEHDEAHGNE